jgi:hypothetical protein
MKRITDYAPQKTKRSKETKSKASPEPEQTDHAPVPSDQQTSDGGILGAATEVARGLPNDAKSPTVIEEPDFFDVEERLAHPCHPLNFLCGNCRRVMRLLERSCFALQFQPLFHFFTAEQLYELEDYMTGEDRDDMKLPAPQTQNSGSNARSNGGKAPMIPFLKAEHLDETPRAATILGCQYDEENSYGPQIVVKLTFGPGRTFKWGLRVGKKENPNYATLVNRLGDDPDAWKSQVIQLANTMDDFNETSYPTVVGFGDGAKRTAKPSA